MIYVTVADEEEAETVAGVIAVMFAEREREPEPEPEAA